MSNHARILCPVPNRDQRLSKWLKHNLRHLHPGPGHGRCQGILDHPTPHPDLACPLYDTPTYIAYFDVWVQFLVDHLEDHISAHAADELDLDSGSERGGHSGRNSVGSKGHEDSRDNRQDTDEDSPDKDSQHHDDDVHKDEDQLGGEDYNHPGGDNIRGQ
ncbi:hypothetical protein BDK51DRAFT_25703 [Blyttiomyces helicus]|uniref:Uncharacterized protein n=1 Tax=Blyttiomyces helicus TaxID=388810 RepID=A0A4P9W2V7_9FUNG|nr:hypothetical protein BDK51DRAFT_25703 [Blyttiomyces helicus]|eukprot:RKO86092.1 hypothetical protein BDK51DRAFT_25703 [Blyttiomyces helicus]